MAKAIAAATSPVDLDARRASRANRSKAAPPAAQDGPIIKQRDIADLKALRDDLETLKARVSDAERLVKEAELPLLLALSTKGNVIEPGPLAIAVKVDVRRNPHWREEFEKILGKDAAEEVVSRTPSKETRRLVVSGA